MEKKLLLTFIFASLINLSICQIPGFGRCPNINIMQNFDVQRYTGLWYEIRKYPFIFSIGGRCITATYGLNGDSTVSVINKQIRNGREDSIIGTAKIVTPGLGSLTVTFPSSPFTSEGNYNILYTDYDDVSVVFSCSNFLGFLNAKSLWILSRSRFPSSQTLEKAYQVLRDNGISTLYIAETNQRNCPDEIQFNAV